MKRLLIMMSLFLPVVATAQVNSLPSQPHLLVKGEAHREVKPDRFGVLVTLQRVDVSPELARSQVQADAKIVLAAFHRHHVLPDSIDAATLTIQPKIEYVDGRQVFKGSEVTRRLGATFKTLADTRAFLAELKTSESLQLSGITPSYSDEVGLRRTLKGEAARQSRETAEGLADAYGVKLAGLYTISDVAPAFSYGIQAGTWPQARTAVPPAPSAVPPPPPQFVEVADGEALEAGSLTLSENVYAIFLIAP
ncbi:SIMPL domain-containing protein [Pseudoxanthomonas sp. JBR18]|uniref:SIMPL domain-containing protein n=1 Tax=Pseudoxanthomonas sp. JBR18 TaxID=2969308 RepID=UPI0023053B33|nr:SIMPL domain-containing protein [Pseudoxanthomonas sp. JBR18]WCE05217.1 SIMPL domain-containing protein [Pseudoxanthomonas sp. JBR18]